MKTTGKKEKEEEDDQPVDLQIRYESLATEHELLKHDGKMASIVEVLRQFTNPSMRPKRRIGFVNLKMES